MRVRVLAIVQQDDAGPGVFAEAIRDRGADLDVWRAAEEPTPGPSRHEAVIALGGAMNAHDEERMPWLGAQKEVLKRLVADGVPVLGVCLGAQLLAEAAGGTVRPASRPEIGWHEVRLEPGAGDDALTGPLPASFCGFQWHSYEAVPPPGSVALARSDGCLQAFRLNGTPAWGLQFHAEVDPDALDGWIRGYRSDPDAVRLGLDPDALRAETAPRIEQWNQLGRDLCGRFLDAAAGAAIRA